MSRMHEQNASHLTFNPNCESQIFQKHAQSNKQSEILTGAGSPSGASGGRNQAKVRSGG